MGRGRNNNTKGGNSNGPIIDSGINEPHHLILSESTRFKLSIFVAIILTVTGIFAYIFDPYNIDKFAFYTINMILPIISYIIGRTIRGGRHSRELLSQPGTRYRTALISFLISLTIGIFCYIFSPENIDKLGMYMIGVTLPILGVILGQSFRSSGNNNDKYNHNHGGGYNSGYNSGYNDSGYGMNHGDPSGYGYNGYMRPTGLTQSDDISDDIIDGDKGIDDYNIEDL